MSLPEVDSSEAPAKSARVSKHWDRQFEKNRTDTSLWTNNDIVKSHIYRLISGGRDEHWLWWFFSQCIPQGTVFKSSLSICCGDGAHEMALALIGGVRFISGFDISEGAIAQARATFEKAGIPPDAYAFEVRDADNLELGSVFDLILSTGALHHVTNLEGLLSTLSKALDPNGYFVLLEYVGPNRFQWTDLQLSVINAILRRLDPAYLKDNRRIEVSRPAIGDLMAIDPSEAVRSQDILGLLPAYFTIEYLRNFNGTIMHPLYPLLNERLTNTNSPDFDKIVRKILRIEDFLIRLNVLPSDFVFAICRSKEHRGGSLVGFIDVFDQDRVTGWAADKKAPSAPLNVDVYVDDRLQATLTADVFRQDLKDAGYGDGRKGFNLLLGSGTPSPPGKLVRLLAAGSEQVLATRRWEARSQTQRP